MKGTKIAVLSVTVAACLACFGCSSASISSSSNSESASSSSTAASESTQATDVSIDGKYVTVDWLADNLDSVVVVDARSNSTFAGAHIPGAINLHWSSLSNTTEVKQGEAGWAELLDAADILATVSAAGIDGTKPVVVYTNTQDGWGEDGRIYWTLREAGFDDVHILDGGWSQWVGAGEETVSTTLPDEDADPIEQVDTAYVKAHMDSAKLIDARAVAEYTGQKTMGEAREGHIPGAVNVPYVSLIAQDGKLLSDDELEQIFSDAGLSKTDECIVYCTGGVRAAAVAETMIDLGYSNVKVYAAGYSEWAGDASNEVVLEATAAE